MPAAAVETLKIDNFRPFSKCWPGQETAKVLIGMTHPAVVHIGLEPGQVLALGRLQDLGGPALPVLSEAHANLLQGVQHGCPADQVKRIILQYTSGAENARSHVAVTSQATVMQAPCQGQAVLCDMTAQNKLPATSSSFSGDAMTTLSGL